MSEAPLLGTVAVVGFPNVGKSTLVNRLSATREAVVFETPGVTRDRKEVVAEWAGKRFILIDTGGVDVADPSPLTRQVAEQAERAVAEADLVLFITDARAGVTPGDQEIAEILRRAHKPVIVVANKVDDPRRDVDALEFHELGLGDPVPASAMPGTTRDSIDTVLRRGETTFVLVDTAGLRRKRRQRQGIEYYSELRAVRAAERADVALVLVDASEGLVDQDLTVADVARTAGCATIVVLSKWDITTIGIEDVRPRLQRTLRQRPPIAAVSAETGRGVERLLDRVEALYRKHTARIATAELNRFLEELRGERPGPSKDGRRLNLLYGTQVGARPPRFRLFVNDPGLITRDYGYWVENRLRDRFELAGVPVVIDFVRKG